MGLDYKNGKNKTLNHFFKGGGMCQFYIFIEI